MKRSFDLKLSEIRVGIIVGISFFLGVLAILTYGKVNELFSRQVPLTILFKNVRGLTTGSPVRISGITSGFVKSVHFVQFQNGRYVQVIIRITKKRLSELSSETTATIRTQGLMGIKYLDLIPGDLSKGPLNIGLPITGQNTRTLETVLGSGNDLVKSLNHVSRSLDILLLQAQEGKGTVGRLLTNPDLYDNLNETTKTLRSLVRSMDSGKGPLPQMIHSTEMTEKLDMTLTRLNELLSALNDPHGTLGLIAHDPKTALDLSSSLDHLTIILGQIAKGKGALGDILYNPRMAERMNDTIDKVNGLLDDMKKDPKKYFTVNVHIF